MTLAYTVADGPSSGNRDAWELAHSRRNLALIKSKLSHEMIATLFSDEFAAAKAWWLEQVRLSAGQPRKYFSVSLRVQNLKLETFFAWWHQVTELDTLTGEPDHWVHTGSMAEKKFRICEFIGAEHLSEIFMRMVPFEQMSEGARACGLDGWPMKLTGVANFIGFDSDEVHAEALHQFRPVDEGFEVKFGGLLPASTPEQVIQGQREHLVVEWTNWFGRAKAWAEREPVKA